VKHCRIIACVRAKYQGRERRLSGPCSGLTVRQLSRKSSSGLQGSQARAHGHRCCARLGRTSESGRNKASASKGATTLENSVSPQCEWPSFALVCQTISCLHIPSQARNLGRESPRSRPRTLLGFSRGFAFQQQPRSECPCSANRGLASQPRRSSAAGLRCHVRPSRRRSRPPWASKLAPLLQQWVVGIGQESG